MKSTLELHFDEKKVHVSVQELLYHEEPAWQVSLSDGQQFMLKDEDGRWVPAEVEQEVDAELVQALSKALHKAADAGKGPFANDDIPAPPAELF
ncbi:MAG: hypothetical protein ACO1NU_03595 [Arcticibacter sp.]